MCYIGDLKVEARRTGGFSKAYAYQLLCYGPALMYILLGDFAWLEGKPVDLAFPQCPFLSK